VAPAESDRISTEGLSGSPGRGRKFRGIDANASVSTSMWSPVVDDEKSAAAISVSLRRRLSAALAPVWSRRWLGAVIVVVLAGTFGMILGLIMPRGPVTTAQAPTAMIASLLVGAAAGLLHRSHWSMLVAPAGAAPLGLASCRRRSTVVTDRRRGRSSLGPGLRKPTTWRNRTSP